MAQWFVDEVYLPADVILLLLFSFFFLVNMVQLLRSWYPKT